jgi:carbon monoxide dehydrogenase subunit G
MFTRCLQVFYFNKALKLIDVKQQPEMIASYVTTIGCLAEALEGMKLYDKAEQSYAAALRLKVRD